MKSSAVSVCSLPALGGRDSVAIFPSGSPVEKENEAAEVCHPSRSAAPAVETRPRTTALKQCVPVKPAGVERRMREPDRLCRKEEFIELCCWFLTGLTFIAQFLHARYRGP